MYVIVNGSHTLNFQAWRRLRQGDPMSTFLFLLIIEGLAGLIYNAIQMGEFQPFKFNEEIQC